MPAQHRGAGRCLDDLSSGKFFLDGAGSPATYISSHDARRQFCADCGSYMVFLRNGSAEVSVNTASLDDPAAFPPRMHIFYESRIPWFRTDDALPQHVGYGPFSTGEKT